MKTDNNIATSMASLLDPQELNKLAATQNVKEALNSLAQAADLMDNMGNFVGAEAATQLMEKLSHTLTPKDD